MHVLRRPSVLQKRWSLGSHHKRHCHRNLRGCHQQRTRSFHWPSALRVAVVTAAIWCDALTVQGCYIHGSDIGYCEPSLYEDSEYRCVGHVQTRYKRVHTTYHSDSTNCCMYSTQGYIPPGRLDQRHSECTLNFSFRNVCFSSHLFLSRATPLDRPDGTQQTQKDPEARCASVFPLRTRTIHGAIDVYQVKSFARIERAIFIKFP